jgi:hypothetical protein
VAEASKLVTIEVESRSQTPSLRLRPRHGMRHCVRVRTILTTFYHMHHYHYAATGDMVKSFIYIDRPSDTVATKTLQIDGVAILTIKQGQNKDNGY